MKKIIPFLLNLFLLNMMLISCSQEEQVSMPVDYLNNNDSNESTEDKSLINLVIAYDNAPDTRCFQQSAINGTNSYIESTDGIPEDNCNNFIYLCGAIGLSLYYDSELLYNNVIDFRRTFTKDDVIKSCERTEESVLLTLKLDKKMDPSKMEMLVSSVPQFSVANSSGGTIYSSNYVDIKNAEDISSAYISSSMPSYFCSFFKRHKLSARNDWNAIDTKIILQRLNSDIIVITSQDDESVPYAKEKCHYISATLIADDSMKSISDIYLTLNTQKIISTAQSNYYNYLPSTYYIQDDLSTFSTSNLIYHSKTTKNYRWSGMTGARPWTIGPYTLPVLNYKNKEYRYLASTSLFGNNSGIIYTPQMEELQYVLLIMQEYGTYPYDSENVRWTAIPLPKGGIKPNRRYIYILGDDYLLWGNQATRGTLKNYTETRSEENTDSPIRNIQGTGFEIIEQSMDEPLPFEIKENN